MALDTPFSNASDRGKYCVLFLTFAAAGADITHAVVADAVTNAFTEFHYELLYWSVFKESHEDGSPHFHAVATVSGAVWRGWRHMPHTSFARTRGNTPSMIGQKWTQTFQTNNEETHNKPGPRTIGVPKSNATVAKMLTTMRHGLTVQPNPPHSHRPRPQKQCC